MSTSWKGGLGMHPRVEWAETLVCRQRQLLSSGNFADNMRVGHDVTGTLAWPEQHGVQGSWSVHPDWKDFFSCCSPTLPFSPPGWAIIVKPCSSFQKRALGARAGCVLHWHVTIITEDGCDDSLIHVVFCAEKASVSGWSTKLPSDPSTVPIWHMIWMGPNSWLPFLTRKIIPTKESIDLVFGKPWKRNSSLFRNV